MWSQVQNAVAPLFRWSGNLSESQWFLILVAVVVVGLVVLRGYGSRASY
jgi:hypothetical protein